jgi:hypothetical protein
VLFSTVTSRLFTVGQVKDTFDQNGKALIDSNRAIKILQPLVAALHDQKAARARSEAKKIQELPVVDGFDLPQRIAKHLTSSLSPQTFEASTLDREITSIALTELKPATAKVGWGKVSVIGNQRPCKREKQPFLT